MKHFFLSLCIVSLFIGCSKPAPVPEATNQLRTTQGFSVAQTKVVFHLANKFPNGVQVAISVVDGDTIQHYGVERVNDSLITIQNHNAVFEIGSISKVFTATLLAQEVVSGTISLDEPINPVFPFKFKDNIELTYKQLSNHTSGLPRVPPGMMWSSLFNRDNPYQAFTSEKLEIFLQEKMRARSDTPKYKYSNLAAGLLGYTLSRKTGKTYAQLLEESVLNPLGMHNSSVIREEVADILVQGRDAYGKVVPNWDLGPLAPAGAILSTSNDLTKFAIAQFDTTNAAMTLTRQRTFTVNENTEIGLGWHMLSKDGKTLHWHNGGTGGYKSCMAVDVASRKSVIVLSNLTAGSPVAANVDQICFELFKTL